MYKGKHNKKANRKNYKFMVLLVSLVLILGVAVSGTVAFLIDSTTPVTNTFTPSEVTTSVTETRSGNVKSNVAIENTGDTTAYIRAAVVVTWQDEKGNVYGQSQPVAGTDYEISYNLSSGWKKASDGFYYWTKPVNKDAFTGELIASCSYKANAPEGYGLNVEILGSGIQAEPASVVVSEWDSGVSSVSGTTLQIKQ